jgi:predicted nucleic acid-binding protein
VVVTVSADLAAAGQLRAVGPTDLIIAATAITHDLTVLDHDNDYEILARATPDLAQQWVVPRGSLP